MNLEEAIPYDVECYPNVFTLRMELLNSDFGAIWEVSEFRNDIQELIQWFNWLRATQTPMIGFNNIHYDYPLIHFIMCNPTATYQDIYAFSQSIFDSDDRFAHTIWPDDRFTPQIDLFKIHHFDNKAKSTSLKALEINMRSDFVVDLPFPPCTVLTKDQIDNYLIPYNCYDVDQTKKFAHFSMKAMKFRQSLIPQFGVDVMNWSDTKIGTTMMENKIGKEICYDYSSGRKKKRQTPRSRIDLNELIFPYIYFSNPEFQRVLDYLRSQVLTAEDIKDFKDEDTPKVKTKGVFKDLTAFVGGIHFHFGVGGIHGSVERKRVESTDQYVIRDIDVASLYPSIAIVNRLAPEHLGEAFTQTYSELPKERKKWQAEKGKKCVEANTLKLASNGVYGNSNNPWSVFYDPKFTLTITVNGQLMLCMLAEWLLTVPTLKLIQINTDGMTYYIDRQYEPQAAHICREWEKLTCLVLEDVDYKRMFIRDVNNYIAEAADGELKLKGAYWTPDALDYDNSISEAQPPAWHKDLGNLVSTRAAVAHMVHGVAIEDFIRYSRNPYDFMCRIKIPKSNRLLWGDDQIQPTTRYFVSKGGKPLVKHSPPKGKEGAPKRANGVSEAEYKRVMEANNWQWCESVCTKNKSTYEWGLTSIQAGYNVTICNDVKDFNFDNVNYEWYIAEAYKLVIG